jgi:MFS family permease
VYVVAAGRFVNVLGAGVVYPFATLYFHLELNIPLSLVGTGLGANSVAMAAGTLAGGLLADRYGRKPVMVASMALSAPALAAYAAVRTAAGFVAVATAAGLAAGLLAPASQALVADLTDDADRERAYGLLKVASNAGFGSGFVAGGVLYGVAKTGVFLVDGATCGVAAVVFAVALPRGDVAGDAATGVRETLAGWADAVSRPLLAWLAILNVGFAVMYAQMQATVPVWADTRLGLTSEQLGTLYVLNPLVIVLFQLPVVDRVAAWRRTRGLVLSAALWASSFVAVAGVPLALAVLPGGAGAPGEAGGAAWLVGVTLVGAFLVLRTVGEILHAPLMTALASDLGTADERGSQLSVLEVAKRVGFGVGPVVGGAFFDAGVPMLLWAALLGGCGLLGLGVLVVERRVPAGANAGEAAPGD